MDAATANVALQEALLWAIVGAASTTLKKKSRRRWCKEYFPRRTERGSFASVFSDLEIKIPDECENYIRMPRHTFYNLLTMIEPYIRKNDTHLRESISPGARLEATLRFLAAGGSYASLQYSSRISKQSLSHIIPDTCEAIYNVLKEEYMKVPTTPEEWRTIANGFEKWNFPHCVGAVDGKHILIRTPNNTGSYFCNYKGSHSIILMAVVNANYEFIYVDVGANGGLSDGGVWANSSLSRRLEEGTAGLPNDDQIQGSQRTLPYVFVGDDAFPLKQYLMKPYTFENQDDEQRIFSYRLSRARRIVDNAFGIMGSKFKVLHNAIYLEPKKVEKIVLACTALHNYLRRNHEASYTALGSLDKENIMDGSVTSGSWRNNEQQLLPLSILRRNTTQEPKNIRKEFTRYFCDEGAVPWQRRMCGLEEN